MRRSTWQAELLALLKAYEARIAQLEGDIAEMRQKLSAAINVDL